MFIRKSKLAGMFCLEVRNAGGSPDPAGQS